MWLSHGLIFHMLKPGKGALILGPDCVLWVKFPIQNVALRVCSRKNSKMLPNGVFYSCAFDKMFIEVLKTHETSLALKFSVWVHALSHYSFCKKLLNFWQFSEYICLDNCSVICTLTLCYVLHQRHSEFWHIQNYLFRYMQAYPRIFSIIKAYMRLHNIPVILHLVK